MARVRLFNDTPGIFKPKRRLDRAMVNAAWQGADDADILLLLHDCARKKIDDDIGHYRTLRELGRPVSLVLNKIDLVTPEQLLSRTKELSEMMEFAKVFMISAEKQKGLMIWLITSRMK